MCISYPRTGDQESKEVSKNTTKLGFASKNEAPPNNDYNWWFRVTMYAFLDVAGQTVATILGRLYYQKGGNSKWMGSFVQSAGYPVLFIPLIVLKLYSPKPTSFTPATNKNSPSVFTLGLIYLSLGLLMAGIQILYSYGMVSLPVSTYALVCGTQLVFTAVFSFFINSQKLTPFVINTVVLLTIAVALLAINTDAPVSATISKDVYIIGFFCTLAASAGTALFLSLTQLSFQKVIKRETLDAVLEMTIYASLFATFACLVGIFASGEWKGLKKEMSEYGDGPVSYVMTLVGIAVFWQVFSVGVFGLIFEASPLFCNVINTVGLPVVPIIGVIFFHDKFNGVKLVSLLLSCWGFVSYIYQHYIDHRRNKNR
ncbi:hypothetical protein C5167_024980 [Papaver somniferum]|uniref:Probable purine permease n=1 Tax=Papaver somniferum TaxID=3469 RepID=A0A4Y7JRT3_PAPSO|nr:hypothetical protein C5167_024980 [Papaver somniferum]